MFNQFLNRNSGRGNSFFWNSDTCNDAWLILILILWLVDQPATIYSNRQPTFWKYCAYSAVHGIELHLYNRQSISTTYNAIMTAAYLFDFNEKSCYYKATPWLKVILCELLYKMILLKLCHITASLQCIHMLLQFNKVIYYPFFISLLRNKKVGFL